MSNARADLHMMPDRIRALPRDRQSRPIPWFVHTVAGVPDFRIIGPGKIEQAIMNDLCWVCGHRLARNKAFVIGPMCAINRISSEPPCHRSCAMYAAQACPFLTKPRMRRNAKNLPSDGREPPGTMVLHNPGVVCVWITREFRLVPVDTGTLFRIGDPVEVRWLCQSEPATRGEVVRAIDKGLPILIDEAKEDSEEAVHALLQSIHRVRQYLPGASDGEPRTTASQKKAASAA